MRQPGWILPAIAGALFGLLHLALFVDDHPFLCWLLDVALSLADRHYRERERE